MFGTLEDKTKFGLSGAITTQARKGLFSWWTVKIENGLTKPSKNSIGYWVIERWRSVYSLSLQTSRISLEVCCMTLNNGIDLDFLCQAMSPAEVTEKLGLHRMRDRSWYVHPRCVSKWSNWHVSLTFGSAVPQLEKGCSKVSNGCHKMWRSVNSEQARNHLFCSSFIISCYI